METLKAMTISLCAAVFLFGLLLRLLPGGAMLEKYAKTIIGILLILTILKGMISFSGEIKKETMPSFDTQSVDLEDQLARQIQIYLDDKIGENFKNVFCRSVSMEKKTDKYEIERVDIACSEKEKNDVIEFVSRLCGIPEEKIHVSEY